MVCKACHKPIKQTYKLYKEYWTYMGHSFCTKTCTRIMWRKPMHWEEPIRRA
jgi:hypothetical protein